MGSGGTSGGLETFRTNLEYLRQASSYRIISPVPRLTPDALRQVKADTSDAAYARPPSVPERVKSLAEEVVAGTTTDYDCAARLERFLLTQYPYDLTVSPYPKDSDAVDTFLFEQQKGYCAQFATAMAVMGRLVGLPTRVAVGYLPGRYNSMTGVHEVRLQDAHAWVEVRFEKYGWVPFDPTPAPNSPWATGYGDVSLAQGFQQVIRSGLVSFAVDAPGRMLNSLVNFQGARSFVAATWLLLTGLAGILWLLRWQRSRRRNGMGKEPNSRYTALAGPGRTEIRRAYQRALRLLRRRGYPPRLPHQTPQEYLAWVSRDEGAPDEPFRQLTQLASAAAYDSRPLPDDLPLKAGDLLKQLN